MINYILSVFFSCLVCSTAVSDPYPKNEEIDIQHYKFVLQLNDTTNVIDGTAEISILLKKLTSSFALDLIEKTNQRNGMSVSAVWLEQKPLNYTHKNGRLEIQLGRAIKPEKPIAIRIQYSGQPGEGLTIGVNKFGDRTFFGNNWPDKARNWLPTIDHPYDKASCEFIVIAPAHYQTIANGILLERTDLSKNRTLTHWKESAAIPTKVMVIGVARFAITTAGIVGGIPVETWVYPQNKEAGFGDFSIAPKVLEYFIAQVAPFPYQKLANVQSTTTFGGMENASNIFYFEDAVNGKNEREGLIAHEIAHQWFGDSASEMDWHHVWLSEGFATYFTNLYYEHTYGRASLVERMNEQRQKVISYYRQNPSPVVDTTITEIRQVLNTNTYQKASWVLHMLRKEVGDSAFFHGIRNYYRTYQHANALTGDFQRTMEQASQRDLNLFFKQWLWIGGHPILSGQWTYDQNRKKVTIKIKQIQSSLFETQLDIGLIAESGALEKHTIVMLKKKDSEFEFAFEKRLKSVKLDPDTWLLFEGDIQPK